MPNELRELLLERDEDEPPYPRLLPDEKLAELLPLELWLLLLKVCELPALRLPQAPPPLPMLASLWHRLRIRL